MKTLCRWNTQQADYSPHGHCHLHQEPQTQSELSGPAGWRRSTKRLSTRREEWGKPVRGDTDLIQVKQSFAPGLGRCWPLTGTCQKNVSHQDEPDEPVDDATAEATAWTGRPGARRTRKPQKKCFPSPDFLENVTGHLKARNEETPSEGMRKTSISVSQVCLFSTSLAFCMRHSCDGNYRCKEEEDL